MPQMRRTGETPATISPYFDEKYCTDVGAAVRFELGTYLVEVNRASQAALLRAVDRRFAAGEGFAVATLNLDHLVKLETSPQFRAANAAQDSVVADGNPIVWLSRLARHPVSLVPGSDLVLPLARAAAQADVTVGLVGSTDDALHAAGAVLRTEAPHIAIVEEISPSMGFDPAGAEADAIIAACRRRRSGWSFSRSARRSRKSSRHEAAFWRWGSASRPLGRGSISWPERRSGPRCGCASWRWNGCGA
jgi:hypothetical protein